MLSCLCKIIKLYAEFHGDSGSLSPWSIFYQPFHYIVLLCPFYHLCFLNIGNKVWFLFTIIISNNPREKKCEGEYWMPNSVKNFSDKTLLLFKTDSIIYNFCECSCPKYPCKITFGIPRKKILGIPRNRRCEFSR